MIIAIVIFCLLAHRSVSDFQVSYGAVLGGPRTDWNSTLITQVICPAYKRLLESCKEKSFPSLDGVTSHMRVDIVEGMF